MTFRTPRLRSGVLIVAIGALTHAFVLTHALLDDRGAGFPDAGRYLVLADNLRQYGVFGKAKEDGYAHQAIQRIRTETGTLPPPDEHGLRPEGFRTPAYPAFLSIVLAIFGDRRAALVIQCVFGALLGVAVRDLARKTGLSEFGAALAGVIWAIHPGIALHDAQYLTEGPFNVAVIGGLWLVAFARTSGRVLGLLWIGIAGLIRPLGPLYIPVAAVLSIIGVERVRTRVGWAMLAIALGILPSALWMGRNASVGEGFRVSTVGDFNLLFYTVPYAMAEQQGRDWTDAWHDNADVLIEKLRAVTKPGDDVFVNVRRLAIQEISERPSAVIRVQIKALVKLLVDHSMGGLYDQMGWTYVPSGLFSAIVLRENRQTQVVWLQVIWSSVWVLFNAIIVVGALAGVMLAWRRRQWWFLGVWLPPVMLFIVATGTSSIGMERFRMPIMLPLLVSMAAAVDALVEVRLGQTAALDLVPSGLHRLKYY